MREVVKVRLAPIPATTQDPAIQAPEIKTQPPVPVSEAVEQTICEVLCSNDQAEIFGELFHRRFATTTSLREEFFRVVFGSEELNLNGIECTTSTPRKQPFSFGTFSTNRPAKELIVAAGLTVPEDYHSDLAQLISADIEALLEDPEWSTDNLRSYLKFERYIRENLSELLENDQQLQGKLGQCYEKVLSNTVSLINCELCSINDSQIKCFYDACDPVSALLQSAVNTAFLNNL